MFRIRLVSSGPNEVIINKFPFAMPLVCATSEHERVI
jgi:hypothetical protein